MLTLAKNKYARYQFEIQSEFEAGIVLTGAEVKSARNGQVNFRGSYISLREGKPYLISCHISPYKYAKGSQKKYNPVRDRLLLLNKNEIASLVGKSQTQGLTLIPLSLYTKGSLIKLKVGIGRGKKKSDKRETIKRREAERRIRRALKRRY